MLATLETLFRWNSIFGLNGLYLFTIPFEWKWNSEISLHRLLANQLFKEIVSAQVSVSRVVDCQPSHGILNFSQNKWTPSLLNL